VRVLIVVHWMNSLTWLGWLPVKCASLPACDAIHISSCFNWHACMSVGMSSAYCVIAVYSWVAQRKAGDTFDDFTGGYHVRITIGQQSRQIKCCYLCVGTRKLANFL